MTRCNPIATTVQHMSYGLGGAGRGRGHAGSLLTLAALLAVLSGCGSTASDVPVAKATDPNSLARTSAPPPADFASLAALERALTGVARCHKVGSANDQCVLITASDQPFLMRIFDSTSTRTNYLADVKRQDAAASARGVAPRGALVGPSWVVVTKVTAPGLLDTLRRYLGGTKIT